MATRINICTRPDYRVDLRLQPEACCLVVEYVEPGFSLPWRYRVDVDLEGIHWKEGHAFLPRLKKKEERRVTTTVTRYYDNLPF